MRFNYRHYLLLLACLPLAACGTKTAWVKDGLSPQAMQTTYERDKAHCVQESYKSVPKPEASPFLHCGHRSPLWISGFHKHRHHGVGFIAPLGGSLLDDCNEPYEDYQYALNEYRTACMVTKGWKQIAVQPQPTPAAKQRQ